MKPYVRAAYNWIRFRLICLLKCSQFQTGRIQLFGYNTKIAVQRNSIIRLGEKIISDGRCVIIVDKDAVLEVGDRVYFNEGIMISSKNKVIIGEGCQFGPSVKIFDNNHCFNRDEGVLASHSSETVEIGANCWIGANAVILKGSKIGNNSVIGAGCVVRGRIPESSIVTQGNCLRIRPIEERRSL